LVPIPEILSFPIFLYLIGHICASRLWLGGRREAHGVANMAPEPNACAQVLFGSEIQRCVRVQHVSLARPGRAPQLDNGWCQLGGHGCARALFGSGIRRLPAGAAPRCSPPRPRPHSFSCLASAACCCFLLIDSSKRVRGSRRHPHRPRLDPRLGYMALTVACLRFFRVAARLQSIYVYIYICICMYCPPSCGGRPGRAKETRCTRR